MPHQKQQLGSIPEIDQELATGLTGSGTDAQEGISLLPGAEELPPPDFTLAAPLGGIVETPEALLRKEVDDREAEQEIVNDFEAEALYVDPSFRRLLEELRDGAEPGTTVITPQFRGWAHEHAARPELAETTKSLETRGYVKDAPLFADQVKDKSRTTQFLYFRNTGNGNKGTKPSGPKTEHKGLVELKDFLTQFVKVTDRKGLGLKRRTADLAEQARSMLDNLTFIGNPEFNEAVQGLGEHWKQYLEDDPARRICVLTEVGELNRYRHNRRPKSDAYLRDKIAQSFTEEEMRRYGDRVVFSMDELDAQPENARLVLLDDWTISGSQMRSVYGKLMNDPKAREYIEAGCLEINVIAASKGRIEDGLEIDPYDETKGSIPVRSYYRAHHAPAARWSAQAHITGLHCAVNYGFYNDCSSMRKVLRSVGIIADPSLASIARPYGRIDFRQNPNANQRRLKGMLTIMRGRDGN